MAADCTPSVSTKSFQASDGFSILGDFQKNNNIGGLSDHFELDATHDETVTHGTALASIENAIFFKNPTSLLTMLPSPSQISSRNAAQEIPASVVLSKSMAIAASR
jgi:hypothetical protein